MLQQLRAEPVGARATSTNKSRPIHRIAVLVELSTSLGRSILEGIVDFCSQENERWELLTEDWGDLGDIEIVSPEMVDGVISGNPHDPRGLACRLAHIPFINVAYGDDQTAPSIYTDVVASAHLAAQHFLSRGLRHLAFLSENDSPASHCMEHIFQQKVSECSLHFYSHSTSKDWSDRRLAEQAALTAWINSLPNPVGIFAVSDILARRVLLCCRQLGLKVPAQIAVLGMGDYELVNKLSNPPLSSVIQSPYQIGWGAAQLLRQALKNEQHPDGPVLVPPRGIIVRESSSQVVAVSDPLVLQSLRFIREHIQEGLHVEDVARAVSVSRRWLEQIFHKTLGRAPAAEIRRVQLETATRLLLETDWPLRLIAKHCGLSSPERLSTLFKREMKTSPGRFREKKAE